MNFATDLTRYGPGSRRPPASRSAARHFCARFLRRHSENFTVASLLLPRRLVRHFEAVYAWCRWADDLADEVGGGSRALTLLRWWREELDRCFRGSPRHPITVALADTVQQFGIPRQPFLDLLFAFEQDQLVKRYTTCDQLLQYCRHSANPVGRLVLYLFESHDAERGRLADNICTALQLTNFWQDVARDHAIGRVYLPEEDRRRFGVSDDDLTYRRFTVNFAHLMKFEVERARDLFYRGLPLLDLVPSDVRVDVELFVAGGLAVLRKIEQYRYNVLEVRPALSSWDKGLLLAKAVGRKLLP